MKVLFSGDSITKGRLGRSFVECIRMSNPGYRIHNTGTDGDTFNQIIDRLLTYLQQDSNFDFLVLQGGYNDLLLPTFRTKGKLFQFAYHQQRKKGNVPLSTDADEVFTYLSHAIKQIKQSFQGKIILVTVGCLGENLQSDLNRQRNWLNGILEKVATNENISLTDTQTRFDTFLQNKVQSDYCLDNFWTVTLIDRFTNVFSARRRLHLTIDGVHLNGAGAEIFASSVLAAMGNKDERTTAYVFNAG